MYMSIVAGHILVRELIDGQLKRAYPISKRQFISAYINSQDRGFEVNVDFRVILPPKSKTTILEEKVAV